MSKKPKPATPGERVQMRLVDATLAEVRADPDWSREAATINRAIMRSDREKVAKMREHMNRERARADAWAADAIAQSRLVDRIETAAKRLAGDVLAVRYYESTGASAAVDSYWRSAVRRAENIGGEAPSVLPKSLPPTTHDLVHRCAYAVEACLRVAVDSVQGKDGWMVSGSIYAACSDAVQLALGDPLFCELYTGSRRDDHCMVLLGRIKPHLPAVSPPAAGPGSSARPPA